LTAFIGVTGREIWEDRPLQSSIPGQSVVRLLGGDEYEVAVATSIACRGAPYVDEGREDKAGVRLGFGKLAEIIATLC
jgi:hypothetical protein